MPRASAAAEAQAVGPQPITHHGGWNAVTMWYNFRTSQLAAPPTVTGFLLIANNTSQQLTCYSLQHRAGILMPH